MEILAVATIPSDTGLLADSAQNSFAFQGFGNPPTNADLDALIAAVVGFYNDIPAGQNRLGVAHSVALSYYFSPVTSQVANAASVKLYDISTTLTGQPHGSPIRTGAFTVPALPGGTTPLPSEVSFALTIETSARAAAAVETAIGTRPKQRHTGRVFIGPLSSVATVVDGGVARPSVPMQDIGLAALDALDTAARAISGNADLGVWSRSDGLIRAAGFVSVDNSFDTQRRRGERATLRRRIALTEA